MCNPNSTIAAFRRRNARAQQLLDLQSGAISAQYLMANSLQESALANQGRETAPSAEVDTSMMAVPLGKMDFTGSSYGGIPTTFSALQSFQLARANMPQKPKPKRRRKPQKPGKTAKQNDRHFVVHDYHDHGNDQDDDQSDPHDRRGGVSISFPIKLHNILDQVEADGLSHIISWQPHGRCFVIHKPKEFADFIMPGYFRQTKLTSFQRQLNLYGFNRITRGNDSGGYYHELFLRGKPFLCKHMIRTKVKGTKFKAASSPEQEPNFYLMVRRTKYLEYVEKRFSSLTFFFYPILYRILSSTLPTTLLKSLPTVAIAITRMMVTPTKCTLNKLQHPLHRHNKMSGGINPSKNKPCHRLLLLRPLLKTPTILQLQASLEV